MKTSTALAVLLAIGVIAAPVQEKRAPKFKWIGINESGGESGITHGSGGDPRHNIAQGQLSPFSKPFRPEDLPNKNPEDWSFPDPAKIDPLIREGFNLVRIEILMERLVPNTLTGPADQGYLDGLQTLVKHITDQNAAAVISPWNFGRYYGNVLDEAGFEAFWKTAAAPFAQNPHVIFDTNNEYHDEDGQAMGKLTSEQVLKLNQAAIRGIRAAGAQDHTIFVEGTSYTAASKFNQDNKDLLTIKDPNVVFEMHQYLDRDGSGSNEDCVSETIGVDSVRDITQVLKQSGQKAFLGEFAGGKSQTCKTAVKNMLDYLAQNPDVWQGVALWGGNQPGQYFDFEPQTNNAGPSEGYQNYDSLLKQYM